MENDLEVLLALYENRKQFIVVSYRIHGSKCGYSKSFAYAISHDLYPIFQSDSFPSDGPGDPYRDCYKISETWASNVVDHVDKNWLEDKLFTFYELENNFGGRDIRWELLVVLRYCFLDGRFDSALWAKLNDNSPVEAHSIARDLADWEI